MNNVAIHCASLALSMCAIPTAQQPSTQELQQQVDELQRNVDALRNRQLQTRRNKDESIAVDSMLQDAQRRSQLMAMSGFTAGYDKGFFIKSDDDAFLFRPGLQTQFRYVGSFVKGTGGSDDNIESGFEVRRLRLRFDGNAFTKDLTYSFVWDVSRTDGVTSLLDSWVAYRVAPQWNLKLGQFKESVFHEKDVPFTNQLAVERSLVDAVLGGNTTDRVQGVSLIYGGGKDDNVRAEVAATDGANSKNTGFRDTPAGNFGFAGRFEYKVSGDWSNYRDFTANGTKETLLVIGGGADFTEAGDTDRVRTTFDAQWENADQLGVYTALHGSFTDGGDVDDTFDWGVLVQAAYCINKNIEIFGRYDVVVFDQETSVSGDTFNEITVGANYYFGENGAYLHRLKLSFDVSYLPDGAPSIQTGLGDLGSSDDQIVVRGQFQWQI